MRRFFARHFGHGRSLSLAGAFVLALGIALVANAATPRAACACSPKAKAYLASMKADLRGLIVYQDAFYADSGRFAATLSELGSVQYRLSHGVELVSLAARADGFDARVSYPSGISQHCWISETVGTLNLADPQCDPWPSKRFPAPRKVDLGIVYVGATYAALWLLTLVVRIRRAGSSLPPLRFRTTLVFLSLAVVHPYWMYYGSADSCNGPYALERLLWVPMMAGIFIWMLLRRGNRGEPPRPA